VFKSAIIFLLSALAANAQNSLPIPLVRGELQADSANFVGRGVVRLRAMLGSLENYETTLHSDGSFEFRQVAPGTYTLTVAADSGETLASESVDISSAATLRVRARMIMPPPRRQATAGTVPVSELRNPPSKKTLSVIGKARRATDAGDHETAVRELSQAAQKNPNDGYLRTNLGVEYLRVGNLAAALPLLEEAARLIPDSPKTHGNLAYAYYLNRDWTRAETEARAALAADRSDPRMRFLLGACLLARGSMEEALAHLRAARDAIPEARALLNKIAALQ
jgi:Flp pilus assembly protein TadD